MNRKQRILRDIAVFGLVFQLAHFVEHGAQLSYWIANPTSPPWLTPWAMAGRDMLAVDGTPQGGNEILHLVDNLIFLAGIAALVILVGQRMRSLGEMRHLRLGVVVQGLHVVEHVLLTGSYLAVGSALGVTTLFGAAQGVALSSLRIWAHFLLNLVATYYVLRAVWRMYQLGLIWAPRLTTVGEPAH